MFVVTAALVVAVVVVVVVAFAVVALVVDFLLLFLPVFWDAGGVLLALVHVYSLLFPIHLY